jgi:hypothetical protein
VAGKHASFGAGTALVRDLGYRGPKKGKKLGGIERAAFQPPPSIVPCYSSSPLFRFLAFVCYAFFSHLSASGDAPSPFAINLEREISALLYLVLELVIAVQKVGSIGRSGRAKLYTVPCRMNPLIQT